MELLNTVHDQITIPGAEFLPRYLAIGHSASDDDLRGVHHLLYSITVYSAWWFGDFLVHRRKPRLVREQRC